MVQQIEKEDLENDPLVIALDHIQYCQLDEAKTVLEEAILANPEREDLRLELCDLYKSTRDSSRFHQMLAKLTRLGVDVADDWNQLNNYFKGQNNNG
jgi:Tfp pilus assembly protein FimV